MYTMLCVYTSISACYRSKSQGVFIRDTCIICIMYILCIYVLYVHTCTRIDTCISYFDSTYNELQTSTVYLHAQLWLYKLGPVGLLHRKL